MSLPLGPTHLKHYKDIAGLFLRHWRRGWLTGVDAELREPVAGSPEGNGAGAADRSLAEDLERLGPTYVKLGQNLSTRPDVVPEAVRQDLARLQDGVEPVPFAAIKVRIEQELGARLDKLFGSFDEKPLGSASLGQVHRATLRDGRVVAVKVQRPGIRDKVREDLRVMADVIAFLEDHTELERKRGLCSTLREFDGAIRRELDYRREAENLRLIARILSSYDLLRVPAVIDDYSTGLVLTMELLPGTNLGRMGPLARLDHDLRPLADQLFRGYLDQALLHGFVHADPHPGNLILMPDDHLGIIDLGMITVIPEDLRERLLRLLLALADGDGSAAARIAERIGDHLEDYDATAFRRELAALVSLQETRDVAGLQLGSILMSTVRIAGQHGLRVPSTLSLLGKTLLNLESVVRILDPAFRPADVVHRHALRLIGARIAGDFEFGSLLRRSLELQRFVQDLPSRLDTILDTLGEGRFQVGIGIAGDERIVDGLLSVANRIGEALVLTALIIGASLLMRVETDFQILGYPGIAMILFTLALIGTGHLLWRMRHQP